jgi:hypothetical protein
MELVYLFAFYCGWFFGLIAVHEAGHYLCGRLGGVPANAIRIRLFAFPQHVVLRDGQQWISPVKQIERYVELVWQYLQTKTRVWFYVAGGILVETVFTVVVGIVLLGMGMNKLTLILTGISLFLFVPWFIIDAIAIARGTIVGDLSGLWAMARIPTAILITIATASRALLMWYGSR